MNNVSTEWNGMSMAYDVSFDDSYGYEIDCFGKYAAEVQVPGLCDRANETQVVQRVGEASIELPPLKSSTGLSEPRVPNPYLGQRDASYALSYDYHAAQAQGMFPDFDGWNPHTDIPKDVVPHAKHFEAWRLGQNDLESMFIDYFRNEDDEYADQLDTALLAGQHEIACEGFTDDSGPLNEHDSYLSQIYREVRESEGWADVAVNDVTHVYDLAQEDSDICLEMSEPQVIMTVDHAGRFTPMASGVMVVKDVAGRACSRLLRVLYDSGGSKSMCHKRVLPRGARVNQTQKQMFNTLAGAYASQGSIEMRGMRMPAFDKNRIIDHHSFEVFDSDCKYDVILGGDFLRKIGMNLL